MVGLYFIEWLLVIFGLLPNACIVYLIVARLFALKKGCLRQIFLFISCGLTASMIIYFGDWGNLPPTFFLFLFSIYLGCEGSILKKLTLGLMLISTVFSGSALCDNYSVEPEVRFFIRFAYLTVLYLSIRYFAPKRNFELSPVLWKLFLLLIMTPISVVVSVVLLGDFSGDRLFMLLMAITFVSFVGLFWTVTVLFKQGKLEEEQTQAELSRKYYEAMEQQNFEIRRLKHDLSNHLQVLFALPADKKDAYIKELLEASILTKTLKYCNDNTVNVILSNKASVMAQKDIEFYIKADILKELPMEKPDICALLGNALDNAVEAVENLPEEERRVSLEMRWTKGMLVLRIENPCHSINTGNTVFLETTKKDKKAHGYGLRSISGIAEKYGGRVEIQTENERFRLLFYCNI